MLLIVLDGTSPYFNLAFEEYALTEMREELVALWRNERAVVVGKNQNAAEEIDGAYVAANDIAVVRRQSGGGAVFHDLGNVNFTIVQNRERDDFDNYAKFTRPVLDYLETLGVDARPEGRNDLVIDGRKCCGNAQAVKRDRIMHHGCILYSADFTHLARALKPRAIKIESHGVKSVRRRVTNIADHMPHPMPVAGFLRGLADHFRSSIPGLAPYSLSPQDIAATQRLAAEKYATWDWNHGRSPAYNVENSRKYGFGIVDVKLAVERGVIREIGVYGDFFGERDKAELEQALTGVRHERRAIEEAVSRLDVGAYIRGMTAELWLDLIC